MTLDTELFINDEQVEQTLKRFSKDLADQKDRVESIFSDVSYEKTIVKKSQAIIDRVTAEEAEFDDKLYEVLMVMCIFRMRFFTLMSTNAHSLDSILTDKF